MIELAAGPARVVVDPEDGGRLASVTVAGFELLVDRFSGGGEALGWGCYPMAPWAGRIRHGRFAFAGQSYRLEPNLAPHAIHGTVYRRSWEVEAQGQAGCTLRCGLGPGWPFSGEVRQHVTLDPGGLHLRLEVAATDGEMPASAGWHPWFVRDLPAGGALEVAIEPGWRWERDDEGIPTGRQVPPGPRPPFGWDDCFGGLVAPPVLVWPGALELTLSSSAPDWVLFDATSHAVCVEPQSGPPDALNLRAALVTPGQPLEVTFDWEWRLG